ncbi:CPBP family intramembrane metalloprotease [Rhodococcus sp. F64268]|uniref:CPBP family intramembrane glutamic endopeptidase n=1 Tax=Rhodococcus sp. F64268 TaxID=2926402 RepID=UPI001FF656F0|nr:type II CAAX endopeptidase family protein [Rhodococcus sp. F64268]MCK0091612.1 CPBP family intramembrane metalloprotease [Rhodococcus sp. F64268]
MSRTAVHDISRPRLWRAVLLWIVVWAVCGLAAPIVQDATGLSTDVLALVMLAPALASAVVWLAVRRDLPAPWPPVATRAIVWPTVLALVWIAVFTAGLVAAGFSFGSGIGVAGVPLAVVLVAQAVGALGEEIGWRGTLQHLAESRMSRWVAALLLGAVFGATHVGYWSEGPLFVAGFSLSTALMGLAMVLIARGSFAQRMIPATLIHLGLNLVTADAGGFDDPWLLIAPAAAATAVVLIATRMTNYDPARIPRPASVPTE